MAIGIDDDFLDDDEVIESSNDSTSNTEDQQSSSEPDFLDIFLKEKGINDKSKIKFENEEGVVEEVDWNTLSNEDKLNILNSSKEDNSLDDSEIQLIQTIRNSGMNPQEYLDYIGKDEVNRYIQNNTTPQQYEIDQYSDDELYVMDLISRMGDLPEDEVIDALEKAKSNESLYKKQVDAIRKEYKQAEHDNQMQGQYEREQQEQQEYEQFSNKIVDEINGLTEIQGFDLNMENDDMQTLYDFITGEDAAGNNYFAKALSDPKTLVKTAWLALNGDQMVSDITKYFQKEIANVRKESYKKGVEDTQKKMNNNVVFKNTSSTKIDDDILDDF